MVKWDQLCCHGPLDHLILENAPVNMYVASNAEPNKLPKIYLLFLPNWTSYNIYTPIILIVSLYHHYSYYSLNILKLILFCYIIIKDNKVPGGP